MVRAHRAVESGIMVGLDYFEKIKTSVIGEMGRLMEFLLTGNFNISDMGEVYAPFPAEAPDNFWNIIFTI